MPLVRRLIQNGDLRAKRAGRRVFIDPASVCEVFGFDERRPQKVESPRIREMVSRIMGQGG